MSKLRITEYYDATKGQGWYLYEIDNYGDCITVPMWFRTKTEALIRKKEMNKTNKERLKNEYGGY